MCIYLMWLFFRASELSIEHHIHTYCDESSKSRYVQSDPGAERWKHLRQLLTQQSSKNVEHHQFIYSLSDDFNTSFNHHFSLKRQFCELF